MAAGGSKKIGRNKLSCKVYADTGRREKNKKIKAERHAKRVAKKKEQQEKRAAKLTNKLVTAVELPVNPPTEKSDEPIQMAEEGTETSAVPAPASGDVRSDSGSDSD